METYEMERAAQLFYKFCARHPELCPHDYLFHWSEKKDGKKYKHYRCNICDHEEVRVKDLNT